MSVLLILNCSFSKPVILNVFAQSIIEKEEQEQNHPIPTSGHPCYTCRWQRRESRKGNTIILFIAWTNLEPNDGKFGWDWKVAAKPKALE